MKALLDTHTFLWWNMDHKNLSRKVREIISSGSNEIYFSAASAWEISIKYQKGRLVLPEPPEKYLPSRIDLHSLTPLEISIGHSANVHNLMHIHQDPFDRLLISQSNLENLPLLTLDSQIRKYGVKTIW